MPNHALQRTAAWRRGLQSLRPECRVAELGSLAHYTRHEVLQPSDC
jgi:hypothetical protein